MHGPGGFGGPGGPGMGHGGHGPGGIHGGPGMGGPHFAGGNPHLGVTRGASGHDTGKKAPSDPPVKKTHDFLPDKRSKKIAYSLSILVFVMGAGTIFSNVLGAKVWSLWWFILDGGFILFPFVWTAGDIMNQVFYKETADFFAGVVAVANLVFALALIFCANVLPPAPNTVNPDFNAAFGLSFRVFVASSIAYYVRSRLNNAIFDKMRTITDENADITLRSVVSSLVGRIFDTTLFTVIAFVDRSSPFALIQQTVMPFLAATAVEFILSKLVTAPVSRWLIKYLNQP